MLYTLAIVMGLSFISLYLLRLVAFQIGLLDKPTARKLHDGAVPLVGGISLYISLIAYFSIFGIIDVTTIVYLFSISILTLVGALDDKFDVSYKIRFFIQILLAVVMMSTVNVELEYLGNILGLGDIHLGVLGYPITVLAIVGAINAFNMVDGIDGLLGGISVVVFGSLGYIFLDAGVYSLGMLCLVIIAALLPYICFNLGLVGKKRKVFMGDAGSMLIGFTAVWLLIKATQPNFYPILRPVTVLWIIALPLMDMAAIMIRRIRRGDSPFKPDREHLHHICQRAGLNPFQTLMAICTFALSLSAFGIIGENTGIPESAMFALFIFVFFLYYFALAYVWRILTFVRRMFKKEELEYQSEN